jgi:hypothetical protein
MKISFALMAVTLSLAYGQTDTSIAKAPLPKASSAVTKPEVSSAKPEKDPNTWTLAELTKNLTIPATSLKITNVIADISLIPENRKDIQFVAVRNVTEAKINAKDVVNATKVFLNGDELSIQTTGAERDMSMRNGRYQKVALSLRIPDTMPLTIRIIEGRLQIRNTLKAKLDLTMHQGDAFLGHINDARLRIKEVGSIRVKKATGDLNLKAYQSLRTLGQHLFSLIKIENVENTKITANSLRGGMIKIVNGHTKSLRINAQNNGSAWANIQSNNANLMVKNHGEIFVRQVKNKQVTQVVGPGTIGVGLEQIEHNRWHS